jgi:hemolysin III
MMSTSPVVPERHQSLGEEIANSISHGLGLVAALAATPLLLTQAIRRGAAPVVVGVSVFAATMVLLYLASTVYHALPRGRAKSWMQVLEHCAIFLLIAGTYTPFALGVLRGGWGWTLLGLAWGLAAVGICLKAVAGLRYPALSLGLYLGMGWLFVVALRPLSLHLPLAGLLWLLLGGLAYTAGVGFFAAKRLPYAHCVWHVFVLAGTACHCIAVLHYAV